MGNPPSVETNRRLSLSERNFEPPARVVHHSGPQVFIGRIAFRLDAGFGPAMLLFLIRAIDIVGLRRRRWGGLQIVVPWVTWVALCVN